MQTTDEQKQRVIEQTYDEARARIQTFLNRRLQIAKLNLEEAGLLAEEEAETGYSPLHTDGLRPSEVITAWQHEVDTLGLLLKYLLLSNLLYPDFTPPKGDSSNDRAF